MKKSFMNRKKITNAVKRVVCMLNGTLTMVCLYGTTVLANGNNNNNNPAPSTANTGVSQVDTGINNLKTMFFGIIAGIGAIILAKNISEAAQAYQQQDSATLNSALRGCFAGFVMCAIGSVLTFLGFS